MKVLDLDLLRRLAEKLAAGPATLEQVQEFAGVSQRTAYRWMHELERRGYDVVRRRRPQGGFSFEIQDVPEHNSLKA